MAKFINNKGSLIHCKGEGVVRRSAEADDIVSMIAVLEVNNVSLPTYASVDLNRIPPPLIPASSENTPLADVAKSLSAIMERLDALESSRTGMVAHAIGSSSSRQVDVPESVTAPPTHSSVRAPQPVTTSDVVTAGPEHLQSQAAKNNLSWSETATKGDVSAFISTVKQANKLPVCVGTNTVESAKVKAVPRVLVCFVGRLDPATTAEDCMIT